jgi:DNA repair exonuclease SbcCD nuclease subunit
MSVTFLHTADWQLGKPFARVADVQKRALLQHQRMETVRSIGALVQKRRAAFVLVAGDLFDSPSASKATVSAACSAIGAMGVPVFAIPGNHDHGGPGSVWEQEFFQRERSQLAPNLRLLLSAEPVELDEAVLFPCPLLRRHEPGDPTAWLRSLADLDARFGKKPRLVLAHGSVQRFAAGDDDEEGADGGANVIDLDRLDHAQFDYVALGDWHGTKQIRQKAWYSGTPENDRFPKAADHDQGNILLVEAGRDAAPKVECIRTAAMGWHHVSCHFAEEADVDRLQQIVEEKLGGRANVDLLQLELTGALDLRAAAARDRLLEAWNARLVRVKLYDRTTVAPSAAELQSLMHRPDMPLVSRVAAALAELSSSQGETAPSARIALQELFAASRID